MRPHKAAPGSGHTGPVGSNARVVTLVLCTEQHVLGALAPFEVPFPFWQEMGDVIAAAREVHGIEVVVLRILGAAGEQNGDGGPVTYLAQVDSPPHAATLTEWTGPDPLAPQPLRVPYAVPGGPQADLTWASARLGDRGRQLVAAIQVRTWNLSSLWRLETDVGAVWLKHVPAFFGHEPALIGWLGGLRPGAANWLPPVLAHDGARMLMDKIPGVDHYHSGLDVIGEGVARLVALQAAAAGRVDEVLGLGLPDRRAVATAAAAAAVLDRHRDRLPATELAALDDLVTELPARVAAAREALPDSVVHGDHYPGNMRGIPGSIRLLDWGDAAVGCPAVDGLHLAGRVSPELREAVRTRWVDAWRAEVPGCDPLAALAALAPVAGLWDAVTYQDFLDRIEPDEHCYHALDPLAGLTRAARARVTGG